jgi:(1->4)-alpha-D-glucan 1-alpha-D-glucosylmutase
VGNLEDPPGEAAIHVSTYRLQFNRRFTFAEAARLVPYLRQLGISHCYASPFLKARPGSSHGYDIVYWAIIMALFWNNRN